MTAAPPFEDDNKTDGEGPKRPSDGDEAGEGLIEEAAEECECDQRPDGGGGGGLTLSRKLARGLCTATRGLCVY